MPRLTKVSLVLEAIAELKGFKAFNAGLERVDAATKKLGPSLGFAKNVLGGVAAVAAVVAGAAAEAAQAGMEYASRTQDMADQTGATTRAMQVLGHVALQNGSNVDEMSKAMIQASKAAAEAAAGNDEAAKKFVRLGIDAAAFARLRPEQQMERLGRAVNAAKGEQEAMAAAMDIIGAKNAPKLMASLRALGTEGYGSLEKSAVQAGQVMDDSTIRALDKAGDKVEELKTRLAVLSGVWMKFAAIAVVGDNKLANAAEDLADAEAKSGANSRAAAKARLEYIDALIKEGKIRQAQLELARTPEQIKGGGRGFGADVDFAKRRAEMVAAIEANLSNDMARSAEVAAQAQIDAAEGAGIAIRNEAKKTQDFLAALYAENDARLEENEKKLMGELEKSLAAAERLFDERVAKQRAALDAVFGGQVNDYQRRGLQLGAARPTLFDAPEATLRPLPVPAEISAARSTLNGGNGGGNNRNLEALLRTISETLKQIQREGGSRGLD